MCDSICSVFSQCFMYHVPFYYLLLANFVLRTVICKGLSDLRCFSLFAVLINWGKSRLEFLPGTNPVLPCFLISGNTVPTLYVWPFSFVTVRKVLDSWNVELRGSACTVVSLVLVLQLYCCNIVVCGFSVGLATFSLLLHFSCCFRRQLQQVAGGNWISVKRRATIVCLFLQ